jgi:hypothetical protein
MQKTILMAVLLAGTAFASTASAATIALTLSGPISDNTVGPQSTSAPCIICGTTSKNPDNMSYNLFAPNSGLSFDRYSTNTFDNNGHPGVNVADGVAGSNYTVGLLTGIVGSTFDVAIDVNTTNERGETLRSFDVIVNGDVAFRYDGGATGTLIGDVNNQGNGYADWLLKTVNLSAYSDTATVLFHAIWSNSTDGAESFFLVRHDPIEMPIPAPLALFAAGLVGIGMLRRVSKKRNAANVDMAAA